MSLCVHDGGVLKLPSFLRFFLAALAALFFSQQNCLYHNSTPILLYKFGDLDLTNVVATT